MWAWPKLFLTPKRDHVETQTIYIYIYIFIFFAWDGLGFGYERCFKQVGEFYEVMFRRVGC